jgi:thymidylate synthase (FAD)
MSIEIKLTSDITVRPIQSVGGDHMVVAAAKVSTCGEDAVRFADPAEAEGNAGLIRYLMKHRHGTPFEHASLTFFVRAPIFVWREWHRHRIGFGYNEESARYKPLDPVFWVPRRDRRMVPVEGWKPGRPKFLSLDEKYQHPFDPGCRTKADSAYDRVIARKRHAYEVAYQVYREDIDDGIAMEVARSVLPVGIYSSCWVTCNPRSLMAFLSLRTHEPDAMFVSYPQAEIEEAARQVEAFLATGWPITYAAFCENGRVGP